MTDIQSYNDTGFYATLLIGEDERGSAKKRRQLDYKQDLELQMREKDAARLREKLQGMSVNASGLLDPEKGPSRIKPLGGHDFFQTKRVRDTRAKPYHTLFALDQPRNKFWNREPRNVGIPQVYESSQSPSPRPLQMRSSSVPPLELVEPRRRILDPNPAIFYQPPAYPQYQPPLEGLVQHQMPATAPVNLVHPLTITQSSPRPLVINHQPIDAGPSPRYNPYQNDSGILELKSVLQMSMLENERMRARLERENADHRRKLERDREADQRRAREQEAEHRRRMEELRREAEERRRQAERERREAERLRLLALRQPKQDYSPSTDIRIIRKSSPDHRYLDIYRDQLRAERRKIEELLARKPEPRQNLDLKVIKQKKRHVALPTTPQTADLANRQNVAIFTDLKHRDMPARNIFRNMFPEVPYTNKKLEWQQAALLKQQEQNLRDFRGYERIEHHDVNDRRKWLEMYPWTPNITNAQYGRLNTARSLDDYGEGLRLRGHRSSSATTLQDDTWLRPSTASI